MFEIWLDAREVALTLPMWGNVLSGTCLQLSKSSLAFSVRNITAQLLTEVFPNVGIEPTLQPLSGESFPLRSTNAKEEARVHGHKSTELLGQQQAKCILQCRMFNAHVPMNSNASTKACYRRHEREKRRKYERQILEVEHGTFTPLVLSTNGGMGTLGNSCIQKTYNYTSWANCFQTRPILQHITLQFIRCLKAE